MSSKNKKIRHSLERIYGKGCMFQKAYIAERIAAIGGIKTYREFIKEKKYTLKEIKRLEANMTLHHLKHRSDGGPTTEENSANINELAHRYVHSLPGNHEEIVNNMLRDYKYQIDSGNYEKIGIEFVDTECTKYMEELGYVVNTAEIIPERDLKPKQKFSRSKVKRDTERLIEEEELWR